MPLPIKTASIMGQLCLGFGSRGSLYLDDLAISIPMCQSRLSSSGSLLTSSSNPWEIQYYLTWNNDHAIRFHIFSKLSSFWYIQFSYYSNFIGNVVKSMQHNRSGATQTDARSFDPTFNRWRKWLIIDFM